MTTITDDDHQKLDQALKDQIVVLDLNAGIQAAMLLSLVVATSYALLAECGQPLDRRYANILVCEKILAGDPNLYIILKKAHEEGQYASVRTYAFPPPPPENFAEASSRIKDFMRRYRPKIRDYIVGRISWPIWEPHDPSVDPRIAKFIGNLGIPEHNGSPSLLLHRLGLGEIKEDIIGAVFSSGNLFLANTSGSGKTRILFEGLCKYWGFYFTFHPDDEPGLGSQDLHLSITDQLPSLDDFQAQLPDSASPSLEPILRSNRRIAHHEFHCVLFARVLIFHQFLCVLKEAWPNMEDEDSKWLWLLLQLRPSLVSTSNSGEDDIFIELTSILRAIDDSYAPLIVSHLKHIKREYISTYPCYVIDDVQLSASKLAIAFRTSDNRAHRPVLREIVSAWSYLTPQIVVSGTDVSMIATSDASPSHYLAFRLCTKTGSFDHVAKQQRYIQRYLPSRLWDVKLFEKLWHWLRGRHSFTADYVVWLLERGLSSPQKCLDQYIEAWTRPAEIDRRGFSIGFDFSDPIWVHRWNDALAHRTIPALDKRRPPPDKGDVAKLIEYRLALFSDSGADSAVINEPLVLFSVEKQLCGWEQMAEQSWQSRLERCDIRGLFSSDGHEPLEKI